MSYFSTTGELSSSLLSMDLLFSYRRLYAIPSTFLFHPAPLYNIISCPTTFSLFASSVMLLLISLPCLLLLPSVTLLLYSILSSCAVSPRLSYSAFLVSHPLPLYVVSPLFVSLLFFRFLSSPVFSSTFPSIPISCPSLSSSNLCSSHLFFICFYTTSLTGS